MKNWKQGFIGVLGIFALALAFTACDDESGGGGGSGSIPSELVGEWAAKANPSEMLFKITSDGTFTATGQTGGDFDKISVSGKTVEIKMSGTTVASFDYSISNGEMYISNATSFMAGIALVQPLVKVGSDSGGQGEVDRPDPSGSDFTYTTNNSSVTITGYTGSGGNVNIPETIDGKPVTTIGNGAFWGKQLTGVTIPNSVTTIVDNAFRDNQLTLFSVDIPNSVTSIGYYAFAQNQLDGVIILNSVATIGQYAFAVNQLTGVIFVNSVTSIGDGAFLSNQVIGITIGANVLLNGSPFGNGFETAYTNAGKAAGRYTRPSTSSTTWTKQ